MTVHLSAQQHPTQNQTTPPFRVQFTRARFWIVSCVVVVTLAIISFVLSGQGNTNIADLDPDSPTPQGSMAVVQVLRERGVVVTIARSLSEAKDAARSSATVLIDDSDAYLQQDQLREALTLGASSILVEPGFRQLYDLDLDFSAAPILGSLMAKDSTLQAGCAAQPSARAQAISAVGLSYAPGPDAPNHDGCFADDSGAYALITIDDESVAKHPVTLLGAGEVLRNRSITLEGNAAQALGMLGQTEHLIWYVSGPSDSAVTPAATLADLAPGWVSPVALLALFTALWAGIWRGRRMGPLTVERLPVIVKASETIEGRGRLYATQSSFEHSAQLLRSATLSRISRLLGIGASAEAVTTAVSALILQPAESVYSLLSDQANSITNEAQLVLLANELLRCEDAVHTAINPLHDSANPRRPVNHSNGSNTEERIT